MYVDEVGDRDVRSPEDDRKIPSRKFERLVMFTLDLNQHSQISNLLPYQLGECVSRTGDREG